MKVAETDATLRALIEDLAPEQPITYHEGQNGVCFWCERPAQTFGEGRKHVVWAVHERECAWVRARTALGLSLGHHTVDP